MQIVDFIVDGKPSVVQVDPENWILKTVSEIKYQENIDLYPANYSLDQNYPNPFNPSTLIGYQLPEASHVSLKIYDELGREIVTLVNEFKQAGTYYSQFSILNSQLPSGIYFYTLKAGEFMETKKMILLK